MSGQFILHWHVHHLALCAAVMLDADPALSVTDAAKLVGIGETTVRVAWRSMSPGHPRRPCFRSAAFIAAKGKPFALLCDVMLEHVSRHQRMAGEIFDAVLADYGSCNERRLWRALARLIETGRVTRHGNPRAGATYTRSAAAATAATEPETGATASTSRRSGERT
jgi:hypothetical protein